MALPTIFANLPAGNVAAALLDQNFAALGAIATIPCTAAGTNAYTLTAAANTPTITAYNQLQAFVAVIPNTSAAAVTAGLASPGLLNCYKASVAGPTAMGASDVVAGEAYYFVYDVALNSGAGGFHVFNVIPASAGSSFSGFSATKGGVNQTGVAASTYTKVTFTTEVFDVTGQYDAPNSKYIPTAAGKYQIIAGLLWVSIGNDTSPMKLAVYKNGALEKETTTKASGTGANGTFVSCMVVANGTTDFFEIFAFQASAGAADVDGTVTDTYFQGNAIH